MKGFLKENTLVREELINYKLIYELKKAAASYKYYLKTYMPSVDIEGYDLIIDDGALIRNVQIKTKLDSKTRAWRIHKTMLLPSLLNMQDYGFNETICPNTPGCIFLLDVKIDDDIEIDYYYTDIDIISLMNLGFLFSSHMIKSNARTVLKDIKSHVVCRGMVTQ